MTLWTTKQLAGALELTSRRVNQLVEGGILPTPTAKGHDPFKAVPAYLRFLSTRLTGGDLKAARIAKYQIETAIKELEWQQKTGALVERSAMDNMGFTCARETRDQLNNIPARVSGPCAAETDQHKIHAMLTAEINQALEVLTDETRTPDRGPDAARPRPAPRRTAPFTDRPRGSA